VRPPTSVGLDTGVGDIGEPTAEQIRSAQVEVCSRAVDVAEARELLLMLGLGGES
jgi:hypothetical protein